MYIFSIILFVCSIFILAGGESKSLALEDKRLSSKIREVIAHYREQGAVMIPGSDIPDPLHVPDLEKRVGTTPILFKDMKVLGLKNLTINHINTDVDKMQVYVSVSVTRLVINGNYSAKYWFTKVGGEFNLTLLNMEASGAVALKRQENGDIHAYDSNLEMTFRESFVDFNNLGLIGGFVKEIMKSSSHVLVEGVKPSISNEVRCKIMTRIDENMKILSDKLALDKSTSLLELAIQEGRKYINQSGYDPYHVRDYNLNYAMFSINFTDFVLEGLSQFHKIGGVKLYMENGTIHLGIRLATIDLKGKCQWSIDLGKGFYKSGSTNFTVDHFQVRAFVKQSLDVRKHPVLQDLDLNVGRVKLQMKGTGTLDKVISIVATSLPDLIRLIIVDAVEEPVKIKMQKLLDTLDVENALESGLPHLDKYEM